MNLSFLFFVLTFLVFCFPLFYSPVSMVGILLMISLFFVSLLSFFSSFWYSYILFLVYVGGLLVLMIYICLASSNFPLMLDPNMFSLILLISLMLSMMKNWAESLMFLGQSSWVSGEMIAEGSNLSIFIFLVMLLLMMLLVVVRTSSTGFSIIVSDKS